VKKISPSPSPSPTSMASVVVTSSTSIPTTATRLIQIGGPVSTMASRFIRPTSIVTQPQLLIRGGQVRPATTSIVRTIASNNSQQQLVWPSQPLTTNQLQDLFQRPRPPVVTTPRIQGPIVRTILIPGGQQPRTVVLQQPQQINTPLPNIQLPSEPVPISPQVKKNSLAYA